MSYVKGALSRENQILIYRKFYMSKYNYLYRQECSLYTRLLSGGRVRGLRRLIILLIILLIVDKSILDMFLFVFYK